MKNKYKILLSFFLICLVVSILLAFTPISKICGTETSSCQIVQTSPYQKTLGISNSTIGMIIFTILIYITASHSKNPRRHKKIFLVSGTTIAALGAIYFIILQAFVIEAFCTYCMIIDILSILALIIIITTRKQ